MKKLFALLLALMLVLSLCACGPTTQGGDSTDPSDPIGVTDGSGEPSAATTEATLPDGMVQHKVTVVDEEGNPVAGVMVQVCTDETCLIPVKTDETGVATFAPAAEGEYHANFLPGTPDGYEADAEVFYFAEGESELTITLKKIAE